MIEGKPHAIAADTVFDGAVLHRDCAVIIEGAEITALVPCREVSREIPMRAMPPGTWLAPGFIDVQVNGGGDVLFNDTPTPDGITAIAAAHRRFGTTGLLPTVISDTPEKMRRASEAVATAMRDCPGVLGIHFEGPFLSPERAGVHDPAMFRAPDEADLALLTTRRGGATLVTLAPECVPPGFVTALATAGVRVALGHSMASYEQTRAALAEGLTGFTHLFNAMRPLAARDPGPIAAALEEPRAFYGLIVDGEHVSPAMLRLALRGLGHAMLVTDAMPPVGGSRHAFRLGGKDIIVRDGRVTTSDGVLAGSALDMAGAVRNCVRLLGMSLPEALRLATTAPAAFLGLSHRLGRIAPGCRADIVALDPGAVQVLATWVAGEADTPDRLVASPGRSLSITHGGKVRHRSRRLVVPAFNGSRSHSGAPASGPESTNTPFPNDFAVAWIPGSDSPAPDPRRPEHLREHSVTHKSALLLPCGHGPAGKSLATGNFSASASRSLRAPCRRRHPGPVTGGARWRQTKWRQARGGGSG